MPRLVAVMDRLRSPGGCPWDAEQTHRSLAEYLIEECYETVEAIETDDDAGLREELGDILLQVVFHARIAQERVDSSWDIDDVAEGIVEKLVRRHPHVFADARVADAGAVARNWTRIKAEEKARTSALDGIPTRLPALTLAQKSLRRARDLGVAVDEPESDAVVESGVESAAALGSALLRLVMLAEDRGWDAEAELRQAVRALHASVRERENSG